ncbi:hypothetical protein ACYPKM_05290 [Pseudomonas aeruginosa]
MLKHDEIIQGIPEPYSKCRMTARALLREYEDAQKGMLPKEHEPICIESLEQAVSILQLVHRVDVCEPGFARLKTGQLILTWLTKDFRFNLLFNDPTSKLDFLSMPLTPEAGAQAWDRFALQEGFPQKLLQMLPRPNPIQFPLSQAIH